jgi:hypothetical protein
MSQVIDLLPFPFQRTPLEQGFPGLDRPRHSRTPTAPTTETTTTTTTRSPDVSQEIQPHLSLTRAPSLKMPKMPKMPKYKIPPPKTPAIDKLQLLDATGTRWADADDATTESDSGLSVRTQISNVRTLPNRFAVSAITQPCRGVAASI